MTDDGWDAEDWDGTSTSSTLGEDLPVDWEWHYPLSDEERGEPIRRTWSNLLNGRIPIEALDREELIHMRMRDKNGVLRKGAGPSVLPKDMRRARARLLEELMAESDMDFALRAQRIRQDIADDPNVEASVRLRAATYSEERARGKVADRVEMTAVIAPWEGIVSEILVNVTEETRTSELE